MIRNFYDGLFLDRYQAHDIGLFLSILEYQHHFKGTSSKHILWFKN